MEMIELKCLVCSKLFNFPKSRHLRIDRKYCSKKCSNIGLSKLVCTKHNQRRKHYIKGYYCPGCYKDWKNKPEIKEKMKEQQRNYYKNMVNELSDLYISRLLLWGTKLKRKDIPKELIEVKRLQLKLHRSILSLKENVP